MPLSLHGSSQDERSSKQEQFSPVQFALLNTMNSARAFLRMLGFLTRILDPHPRISRSLLSAFAGHEDLGIEATCGI